MSKLNFRKIKLDVKPENSGPWHSSSEFPFQLGQLVGATCFLLFKTLEDLKWTAFFNIAERVHELHDNTVPLEEEFYHFFFLPTCGIVFRRKRVVYLSVWPAMTKCCRMKALNIRN